MNYEQARIEMGRGKSVRRSLWCSSLRFVRGQTVWNLSEKVLRSCNHDKSANAEYLPNEVDCEALDWEIAA